MKHKTSLLAAMAVILVGCGGSSSSHPSNAALVLSPEFSFVESNLESGRLGYDTSGHPVALDVNASSGAATQITYYSSGGTRFLTMPSGFTVQSARLVSGNYAYFAGQNASGVQGLVILNVASGAATFEEGRTVVYTDGNRAITAVANDDEGTYTDFFFEDFSLGTRSGVALPAGAEVDKLVGNELLIEVGRTYSLYTTAGTKIRDFQAPAGSTLSGIAAINAKREAVGTVNDGTNDVCVRWNASGVATRLPVDTNFGPWDISDDGLIVGDETTSQGIVRYAYQGDKLYPLNVGTRGEFIGVSREGKGIVTDAATPAGQSTRTFSGYIVE